MKRYLLQALLYVGAQLLMAVAVLAADSPAQPSALQSGGPFPQQCLNWTPQDLARQRSAAAKLLSDLAAAIASHQRQLIVPPGDYRFSGSDIASIELNKVSDFEIVGHGATLWLDSQHNLKLTDCRNLTIRGFEIDCETIPWTQGTIVAIDNQARTIDLKLHEGYPIPKDAERFRCVFFDAQGQHELGVQDDWATLAEKLPAGVMRLKFEHNRVFADLWPEPVKPGDNLALLDTAFGRGAVRLHGCEKVTLEDVTIYGSSGFAIHEINGAGANVYRRCKLIRRPGTNRLMASSADCFHSMLMLKGPLVEDCEFSYAGDDLIAIHGFFGVVIEKRSPRELVIASPYGRNIDAETDASFFRIASPEHLGDARCIQWTSAPEYAATAKELPQALAAKGVRVRDLPSPEPIVAKFDRDVPAEPHDLVEAGYACGAGAVVRRNYLHDGHVRGVLVKSRDLLIAENRIENNAFSGILAQGELYWLEGPFNRNIQITGNVVADCGRGRSQPDIACGAIEVGSSIAPRVYPNTLYPLLLNRDITISGNRISNSATFPLFVANSKNVDIHDNHIDRPFSRPPEQAAINLTASLPKNAQLSSEVLARMNNPYYAIFLAASESVRCRGNSVTNPPPHLQGEIGEGAWVTDTQRLP